VSGGGSEKATDERDFNAGVESSTWKEVLSAIAGALKFLTASCNSS
jgi:hypothetical protein